MFIVMHCGGMPFNGGSFRNQSLGGSETAAYYIAKDLASRGHEVVLFTNHVQEGEWDGVRYRYAGIVTEQTPLGDRYHIYSVATPHDINITQRNPSAFLFPAAAKIRAWWIHDLPHPEMRSIAKTNLAQADLIFTVSEWHRQKVIEAWDINPDCVVSVENGIDLELYKEVRNSLVMPHEESLFKLLYTSRPERGLETLVKPGGVMERLLEKEPNVILYVCGYEHVAEQMRPYYEWLWKRCSDLHNVRFLGSLNKEQLADLQMECDLHIYPTLFEETSCITAMEAMAAGLPFLGTYVGALPETCEGSGSVLLPLVNTDNPRVNAMEFGDPNKSVDIDMFIDGILTVKNSGKEYETLCQTQRKAAKNHTWDRVSERMLESFEQTFKRASSTPSIAKHLMKMSDIYALDYFLCKPDSHDAITQSVLDEYRECYSFMDDDDWSDHYKRYYEYEKDRGVNYGPESLDGNDRFEYVSSVIGTLPDNSTVLDYGCAHGHYTVNLAKRFPSINFVGVDIAQSNVDKARAWAQDECLDNVEFYCGQVDVKRGILSIVTENAATPAEYDAIIAAEVLEHVANPQAIVDTLMNDLAETGTFITTTPYGPWEAMGYEEHWPWRAHVHHFEREDLKDMFGHAPKFHITVVSSGRSPWMDPIGSYICVFGKADQPCGSIDYDRKLSQLAPKQTISACLIVKDAEDTIRSAVKSVSKVVDEFIIRIDQTTSDNTEEVILDMLAKYCPRVPARIFTDASPLEVGFSNARNSTIDVAAGDWILWFDADEVIDGAYNIPSYLRNNAFNSISVAHHHFSMNPAGILKTDYPSRIFRNRLGIKFYGVVHEHPELTLNESIPHTALANNIAVAHYGYQNEEVRQKRFERNFPLIVRDRQENPTRVLGKFLYIRDLYQLTQFELEAGSLVTQEMMIRAQEVFILWESIVRTGPLRFAIESLDWYSGMVAIMGGGIPLVINLGRNLDGEPDMQIRGLFLNETHKNLIVRKALSEV